MTTENRVRQLISNVVNETNYGTEREQATRVLWQDYRQDSYVEYLVNEALRSNASQQERLNSIVSLLTVYGVGTIVEGRLV